MEHIYAPWRLEYFENEQQGCVFCDISLQPENDEKNYVFYRDELCFCVMNKYPYTPGHFLIVPHNHIDSTSALESQIWLHLGNMIQKGVSILEEYGAQGINVGMNLKQVGGAGIPAHLHIHLVPRFEGDTNFFTTISQCRTYGADFNAIFHKIKDISKKLLY